MVSTPISVRAKSYLAATVDCYLCSAFFWIRCLRNQVGIQVIISNLLFETKCFSLFGRGVVRVDVSIGFLDINQCSMPGHVPNAFKGSDRCDYQSTVVRSDDSTWETFHRGCSIFCSVNLFLAEGFILANTNAVVDQATNTLILIRMIFSSVIRWMHSGKFLWAIFLISLVSINWSVALPEPIRYKWPSLSSSFPCSWSVSFRIDDIGSERLLLCSHSPDSLPWKFVPFPCYIVYVSRRTVSSCSFSILQCYCVHSRLFSMFDSFVFHCRSVSGVCVANDICE